MPEISKDFGNFVAGNKTSLSIAIIVVVAVGLIFVMISTGIVNTMVEGLREIF